VPLEQLDHHVDGRRRGRRPLEAEADEVHPDQAGRGGEGVVGRPHPLVADGDAVLVDAVLQAPQPRGPGADEGVGAAVGQLQVLRPERSARRSAGVPLDDLGLGDRTVGALGEERPVGPDEAEGVAHGRQPRAASTSAAARSPDSMAPSM
jgi:hypothetical protein